MICNGMLLLSILHQLFVTFVSKMLSGDTFLQTGPQFNLHTIASLCPIVH